MKLLTKEIEKKLPEKIPTKEKMAQVKFFNPCGSGTWYGIEYDPQEKLFYGYVDLHERSYGYFSLTELESIRLPFGMKIERDLHFNPTSMADIEKELA